MDDIDDLLHYFEEYPNENIFRSSEESNKKGDIQAPEEIMKANVNKQLSDIEEYINERCRLSEVSIKTINNGFTVSKTYNFRDDFDIVYDKNGNPITIDDMVKLQVYYGWVTGKVVRINYVDSIVYINVNGDVFYKQADTCEIVNDQTEKNEEQ